MSTAPPIRTDRLSLEVLDDDLLAALAGGLREGAPFAWPAWWPDAVDRRQLALWRERAPALRGRDGWRPRAIVDADAHLVGHVAFHLPPAALEDALGDPSFVGTIAPADGGAVEIGYTIFPDARRAGYATEAVSALVRWAFATGEATVVLAAVAAENAASMAVLDRVGGFRAIGTCEDEDGTAEVVFRHDR